VGLRDRLRHFDELLARLLRVRLEQRERGVGVDAVSLHEDALGLFDERAAAECALQVLELREPPERDIESVLQLAGVLLVENDVGEATSLGRLVRVARILDV